MFLPVSTLRRVTSKLLSTFDASRTLFLIWKWARNTTPLRLFFWGGQQTEQRDELVSSCKRYPLTAYCWTALNFGPPQHVWEDRYKIMFETKTVYLFDFWSKNEIQKPKIKLHFFFSELSRFNWVYILLWDLSRIHLALFYLSMISLQYQPYNMNLKYFVICF